MDDSTDSAQPDPIPDPIRRIIIAKVGSGWHVDIYDRNVCTIHEEVFLDRNAMLDWLAKRLRDDADNQGQ